MTDDIRIKKAHDDLCELKTKLLIMRNGCNESITSLQYMLKRLDVMKEQLINKTPINKNFISKKNNIITNENKNRNCIMSDEQEIRSNIMLFEDTSKDIL